VVRLTVQASVLARCRIDIKPELGGYDHLRSEGSESFADELLAREGAIGFGGVEESDTALNGGPDQGNAGLLIDCWTVAKAQSHAA
jgi:hypothetical protein